MGSGTKKQSTSQTYRPAKHIQAISKQASGLASQYANQSYRPYERERVAGINENQQQGIDLARTSSGNWQGDMDQARSALSDVQTFDQFDADTYMNPYIKGALDPAARELREDTAQRRNELEGQLTSKGAFSGSRAALAVRDQDELGQQGISDLYGRGYADAFDKGSALWQADQDRRIQTSNEFSKMAGMTSDLVGADVSRLMSTGDTQRNVEQQMKDFDYQQFVEERDWSGRQAAYLTDVLRGLKGTYEEFKSGGTDDWTEGDEIGQVIGLFATIMGGAAMSDPRVKSNIVPLGYLESNGLKVYEYDIRNHRTIGVMADEVEAMFPEAVTENPDGFKMVNYSMIDWRRDNFRLEMILQEAA